jgi:hypothetical protein
MYDKASPTSLVRCFECLVQITTLVSLHQIIKSTHIPLRPLGITSSHFHMSLGLFTPLNDIRTFVSNTAKKIICTHS